MKCAEIHPNLAAVVVGGLEPNTTSLITREPVEVSILKGL
jgi:hypothetical protein